MKSFLISLILSELMCSAARIIMWLAKKAAPTERKEFMKGMERELDRADGPIGKLGWALNGVRTAVVAHMLRLQRKQNKNSEVEPKSKK